MDLRTKLSGFTLMEALIVVAIIAILSAIAFPSYQQHVRKGRRAEAMATLLDLQLKQEKWRANNPTYGTLVQINGGSAPTSNYYTFNVADLTATRYTLTATPKGNQANDKESGTSCSPISINQSDDRLPAVCWKKK
jgi:type IV pilus assembly protein PilE